MENIKDKAPPNLAVGELSGALMGDHHTILEYCKFHYDIIANGLQ